MIFKKIVWTLKRHPFLYLMRFKLLSKNSTVNELDRYDYNRINQEADIPSYFFEVNKRIFENYEPKDDLDKVIKLSTWIREHIKGGPGLSQPSEDALRTMLSGGGGVCSDIVQIFNNFCVINNIKVREWGVTRAPFNEKFGGHSFNEVYIKELNKWVLIDVSWCIFFYHEDDIPLSVVDLYQRVREQSKITFKPFLETGHFENANIVRNYLEPSTVPFLICNYSNKRYDKFLKYTRPVIPVFVTHFILYVFNKSYYYKFPLDNYKKIFV